jgi:hypothetical protein
VSVRNIRNIPKVALTVKPTDPNDAMNRGVNGHGVYYGANYAKPSDSIYSNGQTQPPPQDPNIHQQYAVVKKTGSKRDIRENLERENSALFKVSLFLHYTITTASMIASRMFPFSPVT